MGDIVDDLWVDAVDQQDSLRFHLCRLDGSFISVQVVGDNAQRVAGTFTEGDRVQVIGDWRGDVFRAQLVLPVRTAPWRPPRL